MYRLSSWRVLFSGVVVAVCLASTLVISALGQPAAEESAQPAASAPAERSYVGTRRCIECHRSQTETWAETEHVNAFTILPDQYRANPMCLECHVTGYGEPGGYVQGTPVETLQELLEVGCEACHGPGSAHEKVARDMVELDLTAMPVEELENLEKNLRTTIYKNPPGNVCVRCHITPDGHKQHPPYHGQPSRAYAGRSPATRLDWADVSHRLVGRTEPEPDPPSGQHFTGTKLCASCHYPQYQVWRTTPHAGLVNLPPKYRTDAQCLECHITGYGEPGGYAAGTQPKVLQNLLGVTCESCHGPGSQHVRIGKRTIGRGWPSPQVEQMARDAIYDVPPANVCVQCHAGHRHGEHPEYDKTAVAE